MIHDITVNTLGIAGIAGGLAVAVKAGYLVAVDMIRIRRTGEPSRYMKGHQS